LIAVSQTVKTIRFTYYGEPVAKPRMTRRDKWERRPAVIKYRQFADAFRLAAHDAGFRQGQIILEVDAEAFIAIPESWSKKRKQKAVGHIHDRTPDGDNILKAVCDSLTADDSMIWHKLIEKYFDDGRGPRLEITLRLAPDNFEKL
jgi:Holliday junction resolvase RusA-like endonuclease